MTENVIPPAPPEPPLTRPDSLDQYEMGGVMSIFIKAVKADRRIEVLTKTLEAAQVELNALRLNRAKGVNALAIYGFDPASQKIWVAVREVLGAEQYARALAIARGEDVAPPSAPPSVAPEVSAKSAGESASLGDQDGAHKGADGSEPGRPKIADAILALLKESGPAGVKVGTIKEHLSKAYGIETHDKTPGMTLYRLSNLGKVTRDGRNWFYVDPAMSGKAENPGGETPGHDGSEAEKETAEC